MKIRYVIGIILASGVAASVCAAQEFPASDAMKLGKQYVADFYKGNTAELWKNLTPRMQAELTSAGGITKLYEAVKEKYGQEGSIENERVIPGPHVQVYMRRARLTAAATSIVTTCSFDDQGKVAGFYVREEQKAAASKFLAYKDKHRYVLPLKGDWLVYTGGRSTYDNYHAIKADERFGYDFTGVRDGKLYAGKGENLEDFFSFGQPVLAPADGIVVAAVDKYDDNVPKKAYQTQDPKEGNNIVIGHGSGEFSMLPHLKRGSLKVKAGDQVKAGQEIALCGNSGVSPFPHIQYHLQNTAEWFKGESLPVQFQDYLADGKEVAAGEPVRGQIVRTK
jgi:murein DD-endopeptidase MepM/ murein hydrolase activator NlpD